MAHVYSFIFMSLERKTTHSPCFPTNSFHLFNTLYFSSLEKLNGVKLSVGPSVSWVFGRDEEKSEQWEKQGEKIG